MDSRNTKNTLTSFINDTLTTILNYLQRIMRVKFDSTENNFMKMTKNLKKNIENLQDYNDYIKSYNEAEEQFPELEGGKQDLEVIQKLLKQNQNYLTDILQWDLGIINDSYNNYKILKEVSLQNIQEQKEGQVLKLGEQYGKMLERIGACRQKLGQEELHDPETPLSEVSKKLSSIEKEIENLEQKKSQFTEYSELMMIEHLDYGELEELQNGFRQRQKLWNDIEELNKCKTNWFYGDFSKIDFTEIETKMKQF